MDHYFHISGIDTTATVSCIMLTFFAAGIVKGVVGLGLPTVAVALLSFVMSPLEAAALLVVPSLVTNIWQLAAGQRFMHLLRRLWPMLAASCAATMIGAGIWHHDDGRYATIALGAALTLYALLGLSPVRLSLPGTCEKWLSPLVGVTTGAVTAATGVFVVPAVPYLQTLGLAKEELVQAMGLAFTTSTVALAASLAYQRMLHGMVAGGSLLALLPALAGMVLGQWVREMVTPHTFRKCLFVGLFAMGAHLAIKGLF